MSLSSSLVVYGLTISLSPLYCDLLLFVDDYFVYLWLHSYHTKLSLQLQLIGCVLVIFFASCLDSCLISEMELETIWLSIFCENSNVQYMHGCWKLKIWFWLGYLLMHPWAVLHNEIWFMLNFFTSVSCAYSPVIPFYCGLLHLLKCMTFFSLP